MLNLFLILLVSANFLSQNCEDYRPHKYSPQLRASNILEPPIKIEISFDEFQKSLTFNNFSSPSFDQYTNFITQLDVTNAITSKREAAMFLSQIIHESIGLRFKKEIACQKDGCPGSYHLTPGIGIPGRFYYGRGYIQLTWDFNYELASLDLFGDRRLLIDPDLVSDVEEISWSTAFWFWKTNVAIDPNVKLGRFGATTNRINGFLECRGHNLDRAKVRYEHYKIILKVFDINEIPDESGCYN